MSIFKPNTNEKFHWSEIIGFAFERAENIVEKRENAGYQHFLLFLQCFQKASYPGSSKVGIVWLRVNASAKSANPCQFAKSMLAARGQNFLLFVSF